MPELRKPFVGDFRITSDFGAHVARKSSAPGMDFALPEGTPVLAAAGGTVARSEWGSDGGRYVMVDHGNGLQTLYSHLRAVWRVKGERVNVGEFIGLSGNTGHSTGPHLHFGVKRGGQWVDPAPMLNKAG